MSQSTIICALLEEPLTDITLGSFIVTLLPETVRLEGEAIAVPEALRTETLLLLYTIEAATLSLDGITLPMRAATSLNSVEPEAALKSAD